MELGLTGKGVIITGASRGIGRAIALEFANEGANVAICARGEEALAKTRADLEAKGVKVFAATCDVADAESLATFLDESHAALGTVDVLVSNTSGFGISDDEAGWQKSCCVDIMGTVRATQKVVPWMEGQGGGVILYTSSISGMEAGSPPAYAAAKAAVISYSKTMAASLAPKGIRVNNIAPGSIEFPGGMWAQIKEHMPDMYNSVLSTIPSGRFGAPEEIAAAVVFFASSRASWISGVTLAVDGVQHKGNY